MIQVYRPVTGTVGTICITGYNDDDSDVGYHQKLTWKDPRAARGSIALLYLDLGFLASRMVKINSCSSKPPKFVVLC